MALTTWRDEFLSDVIAPLVDASLQLMNLDRAGVPVNLQLVASVAHCLGKIHLLSNRSFICLFVPSVRPSVRPSVLACIH